VPLKGTLVAIVYLFHPGTLAPLSQASAIAIMVFSPVLRPSFVLFGGAVRHPAGS
jgi:hypothetical protein